MGPGWPQRVHAVPDSTTAIASPATNAKKPRETHAIGIESPFAAAAVRTSGRRIVRSGKDETMVSKLGVRDVVAAVAEAARRWNDINFTLRRKAIRVIAERTGYAAYVVETAIDRLFVPLTADAIESTIVGELGSLQILDDFVTREGLGRVRALPIGRVCVVSSRTTIGVALVPAIFALCAGCEVLVKDREDGLIAAFFETLYEVLPSLAHRAAAIAWQGSRDIVDIGAFDSVVAFGTDETLATVARGLPLHTRFIPHGSRVSAGYVAVNALNDEVYATTIAAGAAADALLYDGEGCMSLHVLFLESGGRLSPAAFAKLLRDEFAETAQRYSASAVPGTTARTALQRDEALLHSTNLFSDERASYLLVAGSPNGSPPLFAPRTTNLVTVEHPQQAAEYLRRHGLAVETLAVSGAGCDYADLARGCGAARITTFGSMQSPPPGSPHGGRPRIAEFVRWIVDET